MYYTHNMSKRHDWKEVLVVQVNKNMLIGELLHIDMDIAQILMGAGMHCIGWPSSQMESLEEASMVHGIDCDQLVSVINEYLEKKDA